MAVDYFLHIDTITGDSGDPNHTGSLDLFSYSFGASQAAEVGQTAQKPRFSELSVMVAGQQASPQLYRACATGAVLKSALLTGYKSGRSVGTAGAPDYSIALKQVRVNSVQDSASSEVPSESVSMSYGVITYTVNQVNDNGTVATTTTVTYTKSTNTTT